MNRGIKRINKFSGEASRSVWMTQQDFEHILDHHGEDAKYKRRFSTIFGISDDFHIIGNFIFKAIQRYPSVKTELGRASGTKVYIYEIRTSGKTKYLNIIIDGDGHVVSAFGSSTIYDKYTYVKS